MKLLQTLFVAAAATKQLAAAHATIQAVWINGVDQGQGDNRNGYIRFPPNNSPVVAVQSKDMTCNINSGPVAKTLQVKAGDKFEFEWRHQSRTSGDQIIDPSHNGPVLVYIAPTDEGASGSGWVKLYHDGYDGQWAVERLRANGGRHGITIPDLAPGRYLLRAEIIALHEAFFSGGAQFYMECVQIEVTSSGTKTLPAGVSIPGAYSANDPGIFFNLYNGFTSYTIPGPPVWDGASSPTAPPTAPSSSTAAPLPPVSSTTPPQPPAPSNNPPPTTLQTRTAAPTSTAAPSPPPNPPPPSSTALAYIYQQCGGQNWSGAQGCHEGLICNEQNPYYSQCISGPGPRPASIWEQCGGSGWSGATTCHPGLECTGDQWYRQCRND